MKGAGFVVLGKSEHAGVRDHARHGVRAERRVPQPVGHLAHARRLIGRRGGGGRRGRAAARARLGRRRLGPHPGRRAAASSGSSRRAGASPPRPYVERLARAVAERAALGHRPRRRGVPRRDRGLRAGRRALGAPAGAAVPRGGRRRPGPAADRVHGRAADAAPGRPAPRRRGARARPTRSPRSATTSSSGRRRGSTSRCCRAFAKLWQLTPALYPVPDDVAADADQPRAGRRCARDVERRVRAGGRRAACAPRAGSSRSGTTSTSC